MPDPVRPAAPPFDPSAAVLAFDCSSQSCSAAVLRSGRVLAWRFAAMARGQSEALMPMIQGVMEEAGLAWADLALIGVTVGPGAFTGIRIGLAAARGMALAGGFAIAGVGSCEAVAHAVPAEERRGRSLLVAIDSKRSDLFFQTFDAALAPSGAPFAATPDEALRRNPGPLLLAGDAAAQVFAVASGASLSAAQATPDARIVARLALTRHLAGSGLRPEALYLRPPDVTLPAPLTVPGESERR